MFAGNITDVSIAVEMMYCPTQYTDVLHQNVKLQPVRSLISWLLTWHEPQPQLRCLQISTDSQCVALATIDWYLSPTPELGSKPAACCCCCQSTGQIERQMEDWHPTITQMLTAYYASSVKRGSTVVQRSSTGKVIKLRLQFVQLWFFCNNNGQMLNNCEKCTTKGLRIELHQPKFYATCFFSYSSVSTSQLLYGTLKMTQNHFTTFH